MRVVVIGAGAAGLVAALALRRAGAEVTVLEAAVKPGGLIQSRRIGDWLLEQGASSCAEPSVEIKDILDQSGSTANLIRPSAQARKKFLLHQGRPVPLPGNAAELLTSPLLTLSGRLRMLREPLMERTLVDPEESVDSFVRRRLGSEAAERLIDPWLAGASGGDPARLVARQVFPRLTEYEERVGSILKGAWRNKRQTRRRGGKGEGVWSCREGMSVVTNGLAQALGPAVRCNSPVTEVKVEPGNFVVCLGDGSSHQGTKLVVAIPPAAVREIKWEGLDQEDLALFSSIPCASLALASVGLPRQAVTHPLDGAALLVATREKRRILGVQFVSSIFPGRTPEDQVLLSVTVGGARQPELFELDDSTIADLVLGELSAILGVRAAPTLFEIARWHNALPQAVKGHSERIAAAARLESQVAGLRFAGAWKTGSTVNEAMESGFRAATRIADV